MATYYPLTGDLKKQAFIDHFRSQATRRTKLITKGKKRRLVVVNVNPKPAKDGYNQPKVQVVDPNEAVTKRAVSELTAGQGINKTTASENTHSATGTRKRKRSQAARANKKVKRTIQRVKDVFDPK